MPMETITDEKGLGEAGFVWRKHQGVSAITCEALERDGFANAFSTRQGGTSPMPHDALNLAGFDQDLRENILENRRRFIALLGGDWQLSACWQVHGTAIRTVREVPDPDSEKENCDGLMTRLAGVLLAIKTADCVPVILGDARTGACAGVHAGWRGTLAGILTHALARMAEEFGTRAEDVRACIGPAALNCCYEVGADVIDAFKARFPRASELFTPTREGHALIDLHRANREQLMEAGVHAERIHSVPLCTMCRTDLFFSHRRETHLHGRTGRLFAVIGKRP